MLPFKPYKLFNNVNWQNCYESWLREVYEDNSQSQETAKNYNITCNVFFTDPKRKPDQYTPNDVRDFLDQETKRGKPPAPSTRNTRLSTLKSFYNYAVTHVPEGKVKPILQKISPCHKIKSVETPPAKRDMTIEEMQALMDAIPRNTPQGKRDRLLFLWYFYTAQRRTAVSQLLWSDLEQLKDGRWVYRWIGKRKVKGSAELPAPVVQALQEYLEAYGRWGKMQPDSPLFPGRSKPGKPPKPLNERTIDYLFRAYARIAGLPDCLCVHAIRHLAAYLYNQLNGERLDKTAEYLGHKPESLATTKKYVEQVRNKPIKSDPNIDEMARRYGGF